MTIEFACCACGRKLRVPNAQAGSRGACPGCGSEVSVPQGAVEEIKMTPLTTPTPQAGLAVGDGRTPGAAPATKPGPLPMSRPEPRAATASADPQIAPLGDLLDEVLATAPAPQLSKSIGRSAPRGGVAAVESAYATAGEKFNRIVFGNKLATAVLVVAVIVFLSWALSGRWIIGSLLAAIGMGVALVGFLPVNNRSKSQFAEWFQERCKIICGSAITFALPATWIARLLSRGLDAADITAANASPGFAVFIALFVIAVIGAYLVALISGLVWLGAKLSQSLGGFFRFYGWTYVVVFGILPLLGLLLAPAAMPRGNLLSSSLAPGGNLQPPRQDRPKNTSPPSASNIHERPAAPLVVPRVDHPETATPDAAAPAAWQAVADPAIAAAPKIAQPVSLGVRVLDLQRVLLADDAPRAVALVHLPTSGQRGLLIVDLPGGAAEVATQFSQRVELLCISRDGQQALLADGPILFVWSLAEQTEVRRWKLANSYRPKWGMLADGGQRAVVLDYGRRLSVWNLSDAVVRTQFSIDNVSAAAVSPGGSYVAAMLATRDREPVGKIFHLATDESCGEFVFDRSDNASISWQTAAFSRDGKTFAAASSHNLAIWNATDGALVSSIDISSGEPPLAFLDDEHVLVNHTIFSAKKLTRTGSAALEGADERLTPLDASGQRWTVLAANFRTPASFMPIDLLAEVHRAAGSDVKITAAELLARGGAVATTTSTGGPTTSVGAVRVGRAASDQELQQLRTALDEHYTTLLSATDENLIHALRWWPGAKTPTIGLRWGVGVYLPQVAEQPALANLAELAKLTGPIGPQFIDGVQSRVTAGRCGAWPAEDPRLRSVVLLGSGKQADLMERAKVAGLDVLAVFVVSSERIGLTDRIRNSLKLRIVDLASRQPVWSSASINDQQLAAAGRGGKSLIDQFVAEALRQVDESMTLGNMPQLTAAQAQRRSETLTTSPPGDLLAALVELRYYHAQGWLTADEAGKACSALGVGRGREVISGDAQTRREVVSAWLKANRL